MDNKSFRTLAVVLAIATTAGIVAGLDAIACFEQARAPASQRFVGGHPATRG